MSMRPSRKVLLLIGCLCVILAGAGFFYYKHRLSADLSAVNYDEVKAQISGQKPSSSSRLENLSGESDGLKSSEVPSSADTLLSPIPVEINNLNIFTADTNRLALQMSLKFQVSGQIVADEIAAHQDNIIRLIRFVFTSKLPSQIRADSCRIELREKINAFLVSGKVRDVVFTHLEVISPGVEK